MSRFQPIAPRRSILITLIGMVTAAMSLMCSALPPPAVDTSLLSRIAFGSCAHQAKPQPIWQAIAESDPQLVMLLGDNIYGDTEDMLELQAKYDQLAAKPGFSALRSQIPVIAIWDDHDYGENDAGKNYPQKAASRQVLLDFFEEPDDSLRRRRPDGIYTSYMIGPKGRRVQILLPDLRWNRDDIHRVGRVSYLATKAPRNLGPYEPHTDSTVTMLGETQWQWLERELQKPAEIRIIASSLQLLPEFTGWESWANFPHERERLFRLIEQYQVNGVLIVSGDTHWGELSRVDKAVPYPLWEMTSSGLTETWKQISPNQHRQSEAFNVPNFGLLEIDWDKPDPMITLSLVGERGEEILTKQLALSELNAP